MTRALDPCAALLARLDAIAGSLARLDGTLGLIGLGSVGADRDRLDRYSDLDFFVIAEPARVPELIGCLDWLTKVEPIAFAFQNTRDGSKVLFDDGIYAEFAVFDPPRLQEISFDGARIVWQREGIDFSDVVARRADPRNQPSTEWLVGEIVTNLYVGLCRLQRGEALAAERLIQVHAVDRLLDLVSAIEPQTSAAHDPFDTTRRIEQRIPGIGPALARFNQGYSRTPSSALAILQCVEERFPVSDVLAGCIRRTAEELLSAP